MHARNRCQISLLRLLGTQYSLKTNEPQTSAVQSAPNFSLPYTTGKKAALSDYRGKVVLLDFWTTWCLPCKIEEPWFKEFQEKYRAKSFSVVSVAMDGEGPGIVRTYADRKHLNFPVLVGDESIYRLYQNLEGRPTVFILDKSGKIIATRRGVTDKDAPQKEIEHLP